jgi:hypothetical protein
MDGRDKPGHDEIHKFKNYERTSRPPNTLRIGSEGRKVR